MKKSLSLLLVTVPSILALGEQKVGAAQSFRNAKSAQRVSKPQSVRLDDASFIEVVGPPIIQESATIEVFFRANKCNKVQGIWSQSYIMLPHPLPLKQAWEPVFDAKAGSPAANYLHRLQDPDLVQSVHWWVQTKRDKVASNQTAGMPPYANGMEIAVAAAIPREFQPVDGGLNIEQPPFHGRGVMIDEQRQIVVWARDIQGIWHGVVAGQCDNSAWQHVALVQNGNTLVAYMDGEKSDLIHMDSNQGGRFLGYFSFGKFQNDTESKHAFAGDIAEIRVWNRPRSAAEIACLASEEADPALLNLAVHIAPSGKPEFEGREVINLATRWFASRLTGKLAIDDGPNFNRFASLRDSVHCPVEARDVNKALDGVVDRKTHAGKLRDKYLRPPANRLRRVPGGCPDECSGHGVCNRKLRQCACFSTWVGGNCGTYNYMGYALQYSGGSFLTIPPMGGDFKSFTAQMWINAKRLPGKDKLMSLVGVQEGKGQRRELLTFKGQHLCLNLPDNTPPVACFKAVQMRAGRWMFVTVTYSVRRLGKEGTGSSTLYINGEVKQVLPLEITSPVDLKSVIVLGGASTGITPFEGDIDELSLFSRAVSPTEVQQYVGDKLDGTERGLLCYYRFDEGMGVITKDYARSEVAFSSLSNRAAPAEYIKVQQAQQDVQDATEPDPTLTGRAFFSLKMDAELGQRSSGFAFAPEWTPSEAPVTPCDPPCGPHGVCLEGKCVCLDSWVGDHCEKSRCPNACSGHGECIPFNENNQKYMLGGTMRDRLAAFGVDIDKVVSKASKAVGAAADQLVALALGRAMGKSVSEEVTKSMPQLQQENGTLDHVLFPSLGGALHAALEHTHQYVCLCDKGFAPPSCTDKACPFSCGLHGQCHKNGTCVCNHGWMGEKCLQRACTPSATCSDNGECIEGKCNCFAGWTGDDCANRDICPRDCSGHGQCGLHRVCKCDPLYTGVDCSWSAKCPNFCSGRGWCGDNGCNCREPFQGKDCSQLKCPNDCSGNGDCVHGRCVCKPGFGGSTCGKPASWPLRCRTTIVGRTATYSCSKGQLGFSADSPIPIAHSPYDVNKPLYIHPSNRPSVRLSFELSQSADEQKRREKEAEENAYNPQELHPDAQMYQKKWDHIVKSFDPVPTTSSPPETTTTPYVEETTEVNLTPEQGETTPVENEKQNDKQPPAQFKESDQQTRKDLAGNDVNLSPDAESSQKTENRKVDKDLDEEKQIDRVAAEADEI